jgi:uncharacterized protein with HEPN domain
VPSRNWLLRIEDILEAIAKIELYVDGMDFDQWQRDQKTVDAVVRNLEIIGEAASHVPQDIQCRFSSIPWGKMKGIRKYHDSRLFWSGCLNTLDHYQ